MQRIIQKSRYVNKKLKKRSKKLYLILFLFFLAIFVFSIFNLLRWGISNIKTKSISKSLRENSFNDTVNTSSENKNPINFDYLKGENSDTVGWIKIDNTNIDYPIVQTNNNDYYLTMDFNKKWSSCGWIFMDFRNNSKFIDKNTVIYGHNLKSKLMFADVQKIYNNELGDEIYIDIYSETEKLSFKVFSCYMEEPEDYATKANISTEIENDAYIKEMLKRSEIDYGITPDKSDRLLTLSTCDKTGNYRILVHAVYINGEKYYN